MTDIQIEITNLPQIKRAFAMSPLLMTKELNVAIKRSAIAVQRGEIRQYHSLGIGIVTRGLISSIQRGIGFGNLRAEVGPNISSSKGVDYAGFVHDGTRYMNGRPFLRNSIESEQGNIDANFHNSVQLVLDQIGKQI